MQRDVEVLVKFVPTDAGGRSAPVSTGYRPQFYYAGHDWDAVHEYPDHETVLPGQEVRAFLAFLSPAEHLGKVIPELTFEIREGARVVAHGRVLRLIDLYESAWRARLHDALENYYLSLGSSVPVEPSSAERDAYQADLRQARKLRELLKTASLATFREELAATRSFLDKSLNRERKADLLTSVDGLVQLADDLSRAG